MTSSKQPEKAASRIRQEAAVRISTFGKDVEEQKTSDAFVNLETRSCSNAEYVIWHGEFKNYDETQRKQNVASCICCAEGDAHHTRYWVLTLNDGSSWTVGQGHHEHYHWVCCKLTHFKHDWENTEQRMSDSVCGSQQFHTEDEDYYLANPMSDRDHNNNIFRNGGWATRVVEVGSNGQCIAHPADT